MTTRVRVLLCDDHEMVRKGVRAVLQADLTIDVVGEAASADEAVALATELEPDVVIMDVRMPGRSGVEACRDIRAARDATKVLMLTSFTDDEALFTAIMAGASGYLVKSIAGNDFVRDVHKVASGQSLLDPSVTERVLARLRGDRGPAVGEPGADLTPQERRVLALMAEGHTNRQIGVQINLAEKTVKNYVSNVLMKLGLSRRAEVAAYMAKRRPGDDRARRDWP
ncbi:MAG: response regulator transcription factor [Candidatus Dormibacter sp.]